MRIMGMSKNIGDQVAIVRLEAAVHERQLRVNTGITDRKSSCRAPIGRVRPDSCHWAGQSDRPKAVSRELAQKNCGLCVLTLSEWPRALYAIIVPMKYSITRH
jgi:hypothetical protein